MSDYIDRMKVEHNELKEKIEKIKSFIYSDKFNSLPEVERIAMIEQSAHMECYRRVLDGRIWRAHGNK